MRYSAPTGLAPAPWRQWRCRRKNSKTIAAIVNEFVEVNHNYEREHSYNLWFVVVAADEDRLQDVLAEIELRCGYPLLDLPLLNEHFIDLGFDLKWT